jgi:hypothetical protein
MAMRSSPHEEIVFDCVESLAEGFQRPTLIA